MFVLSSAVAREEKDLTEIWEEVVLGDMARVTKLQSASGDGYLEALRFVQYNHFTLIGSDLSRVITEQTLSTYVAPCVSM